MPLIHATRAKCDPIFLSLSRIRYVGVCSYGIASRNCCATQASVGDRVTFTWIRLPRLQLDNEEGEKGTKEEISNLQEITGPHLCRMIAEKGPPSLSTSAPWMDLLPILLNSPFTHVISSLRSSPRIRSAPQSRLFVAISLLKQIVSGESLDFLAWAFELRFQNMRKSSRWKPRKCLRLNKKEGLFPGSNYPGQEHQEKLIALPIDGAFHLSPQDDQLMSQQRVFRQQFGFASG